MADDTKDRRSSGPSTTQASPASGAKRPYATLDLKATEIKITPVAGSAARGTTVPQDDKSTSTDKTPGPAPASTYALSSPPEASAKTGDAKSTATAPGTASKTSAPSSAAKTETVVVSKRGGFFSHMAAGVVGGLLALAASQWGFAQFGLLGTTPRGSEDTAAIGQRLQALEKTSAPNDSKALAALETRVVSLEKSNERIPAIAESQSRLVADTKAALAAAASDKGVPEQITRVAALEDKLKAMTEAGANDPNASRIAQLAALTGKVSDLETSLATQLTAFRKSVSDDVDARLASVTASAEAAKSGTQRVDKDVATLKGEAAALTDRLQALKTDNERLNANLKMAQDETTALKAALENLKSSTAKPNDVAAAVKPVGDKIAAIEQSIQSLMKGEDDRRSNSERILLSLELQNLKRALDSGQKYATELAAVKKASTDKFDLASLDKFKDVGVPSLDDLTREFRATANAAIDAETEPAEGNVVDRLIAGAKSVVRVRKVNHTPDDKSTEAIVGRMEMSLKENQLTDVLSAAKELPPKALAAAQPFLDRVAARVSVDAAVAAIESQLKTSLGGSPAPVSKNLP